jgi:hypothetical protein
MEDEAICGRAFVGSLVSRQKAAAVRDLSISGGRVLLALAMAVCSMGPLMRACCSGLYLLIGMSSSP